MMCKCGVVLSISVVIVSSLILLVTSFNVDTVNYVQHKGPEQSMFGFSVATHKEHGRSWVLVGAPTSQGQRSRIHRGGVVFKCPTTSDNGCEEVDFHQEKSGPVGDDKNNQWFGATVSSAGPDGPVVACAPRYVWFTTREERRDPVGTCYIAKDDFRKFSEYSPCRTSFYGYHRQGSCQAGFSAGISKDGKRLFVGAPGSWYWQGQMYSIDPMIKYPFTPGLFGEAFGFTREGQVIQQSLDDRPAVTSTPEGPAKDDDSYMGYSMVVGDFNNAGVQGIAVGMPKGGEMLEGKVLFYTWNLTNYLNITGKQLGSYFGYALAASDIDGDGRDDLIVGAPMHTEPNNEMKYEVGRVHIAYQGRAGNYAVRSYLDGFNSKSRFGLSLSTLGDMNLDGYGDFAVGAPYDGPHERGAVYIFQGSANGVIKQYSQVIYAEDVDVKAGYGNYYPLSTFGFSIAGGLDLDGNDYPDVAIGAYLSDTAYFFRTRPVVRVEAIVKFDEPKVISLDRKTCNKPGDPNTKVPCTWIQVCMKYTGVGAPQRIDLNLQYILDAQKSSYSRIYSSRGNGKEVKGTITLYKDAPLNCDRSLRDTIYVKESIADKLTDLEIQVKYSLLDSGIYPPNYQRDPRGILLPIIDLSTPAIVNDTVTIFKNCGSDNVCIPDLHLFVRKEVTKYLYDADKPIEFDIEITNTKDDSYNTKFYLELPQDIEFRGAPIIDNTGYENKLACSPVHGNSSLFVCDIGNPMIKNTRVHFKLRVAPKRDQALLKPTYVFRMNVTSVNPENVYTLEDNSVTISIDIWVDAILSIEGKSSPNTVYYNVSQYNTVTDSKWDTELGPPVIHSYTIINKGPSDVNEVEIYIIWPGSTLAGEDLLYLLEPPHTLEGVKCERVDTNVREKALSLQGNIWDITGIHKHGNETIQGPGTTEVQTDKPTGVITGNTITRTISVLTFYDENQIPIHVMEIIGEPGNEEYWKTVSIAASQFKGPITVQGNSSSLVIEYLDGREISRTIVTRQPRPGELPYMSYRINSNVTTIVSYYGLAGNYLEEEYIVELPGSQAFKDRIESTKNRLRQPVKLRTNTTWHFDYTTSDGKIHYHYTLSQTGTEDGTSAEISSTVTHTIIKFYDANGNVISETFVEGEPNTAAYWEHINKISSRFHEPITIRITSTKVITYILNGKEIRKEEIAIPISPEQASLTSTTTTITTVKVTSLNGRELFNARIPGEKGSQSYNEYFNNILSRIREPAVIETKTVYTILYRNREGRQIYEGIYTEIGKENYNPNKIESSRTTTITTVTFFDVYGNILRQENITAPVGSTAYWERIYELTSGFQKQEITTRITTRTIITYYINGEEVRSEDVKGAPGTQEITFRPQTVISTTITVQNLGGKILYQNTVKGRVESVNDIISRYHEPITIEIKTTYTITYVSSDGRIRQTGTYIETRTETHHPAAVETSQIHNIITIILYDRNRNVVHQENITDEVGTEAYWERLNGIISRFHQHDVTVHITSRRIITYYIGGREIRSEESPSGKQELSYRPQTVITTRIVVYGSDRRLLDDRTVPGRKDSITDIISQYNEFITIEIYTIYTITYYNSNNQVTYTGTFTETRRETHQPSKQETTRKIVVTTFIFYDANRNIIDQRDIREEPQSEAYWNQVNKLIVEFQKQHQHITFDIRTRTIITHYVDGHVTHTEEVTDTPGSSELSFTSRIVTTTTVIVSNLRGQILFEGSVNGGIGSSEYTNYIQNLISKYREPITMQIETTYTITYHDASGRIVYTGREYKRQTTSYNQHVTAGESQTTFTTTIQFFDSNGRLVDQLTISDEPKSTAYWEHIKKIIANYNFPVNVYTNSSKIVTYYNQGVVSGTEYLPGTVIVPFTSHVEDAVTEITYEDVNKNVIHRETVNGELTQEEKKKRATEFSKRYHGSFTVEIETTKTITFRTFDGQVLYTDAIGTVPNKGNSRIVIETTLTVYGPDGRTVIDKRNINGEPGSQAYNDAIADIISRHSGSITIYTNTTKTITYYNDEGRTINQQSVAEPRSTVQRQSDSHHADRATTTITFYGPDGKAIHHDTIDGAPGQDIHRQLNEIAREYGGVVKSYGGTFNEDGSIGGPVTVVDSPYPGGKPQTPGQHFTDFEAPHGQQHTQWNSGFNHSEGRYGGSYGHGSSDSYGHGTNFQDLNVNQGDLGAFAKGKGFRTGGIDLGIHSGNVDQTVDGSARRNFESYSERQSYDGSHNYLSGSQNYQHDASRNRERHGKRKREVDTTDSDIEKLSQCTTSKCFTIKCVSGTIRKGHEVHIALRARVVVQTLKNISMTQPVNIQSMLLARISRFQEISGAPAQRTLYRQQTVTSVMAPSPDIKPDIVPLWVVILSAVAGTLILLLLIFLLHKCGFFKRNRPSDAPERQPLNRNGHFQHGDEAL